MIQAKYAERQGWRIEVLSENYRGARRIQEKSSPGVEGGRYFRSPVRTGVQRVPENRIPGGADPIPRHAPIAIICPEGGDEQRR